MEAEDGGVSRGGADERFFRTLVDLVPQMIWTKDASGLNDYCNQRFMDFMNVTMDEFITNSWAIAHPDDVANAQEAWKVALTTGAPYEAEVRLRPKDGLAYRWFLVRAVPHRDAFGRVDKWFGSTTDIDSQRRAFAAIDFLATSGARLAGAHDVPTVLDRLAHAALDGLADISIFDLEEEDGRYRRLTTVAPELRASAIETLKAFMTPPAGEAHPIARVMRDLETIHVPSVDEEFIEGVIAPRERREAWRFLAVRSLVCAPIHVPGRVRGVLTLVRTGISVPFEASEVRVTEEVARRAAVAIDNSRLRAREELTARNLRAFADMGESIAESVGLRPTLDAAMRVIVPARADWAFLNLVDESGDLRLAAVFHPDAVKRARVAERIGDVYARADTGHSIAAEVMRTKSPVCRERIDYADAAATVNLTVLDAVWSAGVASFIVMPLFSGAAVRGTLHLCRQADEAIFGPSDVEFFGEFARRLAPAIANAEIFERERRVARSFQDAALPQRLPDLPGFVFRAIYQAGKAEALVGGDWYDAFVLADGRIVVSIGDVAGSGLSAAVTMASVRQAIRGAAHAKADPSGMLDAAERSLDDPERRFVTAFVGVIDPTTATITYQCAGHPPPLLRKPDGSIAELASGGPPLGLRLESDALSRVAHIPAGSLLVLYTDGLIESTHDILEGEARLRAALAADAVVHAENPAQLLHDLILLNGSRDDVAILTVQFAEVALHISVSPRNDSVHRSAAARNRGRERLRGGC